MRDESIHRAWGTWLAQYPWHFWGVLTAHWESPTGPQMLRAWGTYVERLTRALGRTLSWAVFYEEGTGGQGHLHFLMYTPDVTPDPEAIKQVWTAGIADVRRYEPTRYGAFYATKRVGRSADAYDISETLPPRRDH